MPRKCATTSGFERERWPAVDLDLVAGGHLPTLAELDLAVDADAALGDEGLGLTPAEHPAGELEDLRQMDRAVTDAEAVDHGVHPWCQVRCRARGRCGSRLVRAGRRGERRQEHLWPAPPPFRPPPPDR